MRWSKEPTWPSSPTIIRVTKTRFGIFRDVLEGSTNSRAVEVIPDRVEAIQRALEMARPDDCVLLAGKGHEDFQIIGDDALPLDDREVAREWLYEAARTTNDE